MMAEESETSNQPLAEDQQQDDVAPHCFNKTHRMMLLFVIAVQVGMLGYDFALSRQQQQPSTLPSMTLPVTKQQLLSTPKEEEYHVTNGKGNVRERTMTLRELMPKEKRTKAPSIKSSKAPSVKSDKESKAPSIKGDKESKAPSIKSTRAPSLKSSKADDEPTVSVFPTVTPTSSPSEEETRAMDTDPAEIEI